MPAVWILFILFNHEVIVIFGLNDLSVFCGDGCMTIFLILFPNGLNDISIWVNKFTISVFLVSFPTTLIEDTIFHSELTISISLAVFEGSIINRSINVGKFSVSVSLTIFIGFTLVLSSSFIEHADDTLSELWENNRFGDGSFGGNKFHSVWLWSVIWLACISSVVAWWLRSITHFNISVWLVWHCLWSYNELILVELDLFEFYIIV